MLADAEWDVPARVHRREEPAALELRLRRLDEVRGAADHRRRVALERVHDLLARVARRDVLAGGEVGQCVLPALLRLAAPCLVPFLTRPRVFRRPLRELLLPRRLELDPALG